MSDLTWFLVALGLAALVFVLQPLYYKVRYSRVVPLSSAIPEANYKGSLIVPGSIGTYTDIRVELATSEHNLTIRSPDVTGLEVTFVYGQIQAKHSGFWIFKTINISSVLEPGFAVTINASDREMLEQLTDGRIKIPD